MKKYLVCFALLCLMVPAAQSKTVTLRVWDSFTDSNMYDGMSNLIKAFEKKYPNIKIERDAQRVDDMRPVLQSALTSGTGPDVVYYDTGPGFAGVLAKAGLIMPLDKAYSEYDWSHIYPWTKERTTFDGKVYGIGNELEFYGVFYNKDLFKKLNLSIPKTYGDFVEINEKILKSGKTPIAFGDAPGWPAYHVFSVYANNHAGKKTMERLLFGDASWENPAIVKAIDAFFVKTKKYLTPTPTAVSFDDAVQTFTNGSAAMFISGSWLMGRLDKNTKFNVGFFFLPGEKGSTALPPAGLGSGYFISSKSKHPKEATLFLDFLFNPKNAKYWIEDMVVIPSYSVNIQDFKVSELYKFAIDKLSTSSKDMGYNVDVLTTDKFNNVMSDGFQAVLLGSRTPAEQAAALQAAKKAGKKKRN